MLETQWMRFCIQLAHWGLAGRSGHGPKGLGNPKDSKRLPPWSLKDDQVERLIREMRDFHNEQTRIGDQYAEVLRYRYVLDISDEEAAQKLNIPVEVYTTVLDQAKQSLFRFWLSKNK